MIKHHAVLSAAIAAIALAGCTPVIVQEMPGPRADYFDGDFEYATSKGAIVTQIAGNPFGLPKDQFDEAIRRQLTKSVIVGTAKFVANPGEDTLAPFKVVVAFNTEPGIGNSDLCRQGANTPVISQKGRINMKIAFCDGDQLKSGSAAWVHGASNADDKRFKALVKQAAVAMLPVQDSEETGETTIR